MARSYTHELNKEVQSICGWYALHKEERLAHRGKEYLYLMGNGVIESSCCGTGGCLYAVVPGAVVEWKSGTNEEGLATSIVEPVRDKRLQDEIRALLTRKEGVSQLQFW
jgi:hypothetical protein